jgi:hypothetical protein
MLSISRRVMAIRPIPAKALRQSSQPNDRFRLN